MPSWPFWLAIILLALLLILSAIFALRDFDKNRKVLRLILYYILLVVLALLVLKLIFAVFGLAVAF